MNVVVTVESACKSYGPSQVINGCSFQIHEGEIYGLLGINGAGKTTLMKMLLGLQRIDGGSISVLGREVGGSREYLADVGSVIETPVFYEHLHAEEPSFHASGPHAEKGQHTGCLTAGGAGQCGQQAHLSVFSGHETEAGTGPGDHPSSQASGFGRTAERTGSDCHHGYEGTHAQAGRGRYVHSALKPYHRGNTSYGRSYRNSCGGAIRQEFVVKDKVSECGENFEEYVVGFMRRDTYELV